LYLTTSKPLNNRLYGSDLDVRIANSRVGLQGWTRATFGVEADFRQIAIVCGAEISLLRGLRGLDAGQRAAVDGLLARWAELRAHCEAQPRRATRPLPAGR
jgi:hypothetical protein